TTRLRFYSDSRRRRRVTVAVGLLLAIVAAVAAVVVANAARTTRHDGPLSVSEVTGAARAFASAYGSHDPSALPAVLAPDVTRISTTVTERGRAAVLAEYARQFRTDPSHSYKLEDPAIVAGTVGRLAAHYTVLLKHGGTITGRVVFGVKRVNGRPKIGLIVTQQSG